MKRKMTTTTVEEEVVFRDPSRDRVPSEQSDFGNTTQPHCTIDMVPFRNDTDTTEIKNYIADDDNIPRSDSVPLLERDSPSHVSGSPAAELLVPPDTEDLSTAGQRAASPDGSPVHSSAPRTELHVDESK